MTSLFIDPLIHPSPTPLHSYNQSPSSSSSSLPPSSSSASSDDEDKTGTALTHSACQYQITRMSPSRVDVRYFYHLQPCEALFYQLKGDLVINLIANGEFKHVVVREGDMFLLPADVPYAPQRLGNTCGLIIERRREEGEEDEVRWYCRYCHEILHQQRFQCVNSNVPSQHQSIQNYYNSENLRKCTHCQHIDPLPMSKESISGLTSVEEIVRTTLNTENNNVSFAVDRDSLSSQVVTHNIRTTVPPLNPLDLTSHPAPFSLTRFIEKYQHELQPPVNNKLLYGGPDCENHVQIVGGPNHRTDFHIEDGEEWFYQIKGDMVLKVVDNGVHKDIAIRQGEHFLLPAHVPHSPQRFANTIGLVVERRRMPHWMDGLRWYCGNCENVVYDTKFVCVDLVSQLKQAINDYYQDESKRLCRSCGTIDVKHRVNSLRTA